MNHEIRIRRAAKFHGPAQFTQNWARAEPSRHVIPKQFKTHSVIVQNRYDVNASGNLILMPTPIGKLVMNGVRADRLTHGWGHRRYDAYVKSMLDCIKSEEDLIAFRDYLRRYVLRHEPYHVPWT